MIKVIKPGTFLFITNNQLLHYAWPAQCGPIQWLGQVLVCCSKFTIRIVTNEKKEKLN